MTTIQKHKSVLAAAIIGAALALGAAITSESQAGGELSALTWEGYTDPSFVSIFEERTGCKFRPTYVGSNDEIMTKMAAGGGVYDLVSPAVNYSQMMIEMDVFEPLDPARLENFDDIFESFRTHPGVRDADGTIWAMPMAWGAIPLMYRTDKFDEPPTSATVLWDPKYKGKIATQDVSMTIFMAARIVFGPDTDVYNLSDEQLEIVKLKLIEQKPLLRTYWAQAGDLIDLYVKGEVWVSETWGGYQVAVLQEQGIPVAEAIPIEKADGWQDVWNVVKGTPNLDCAYDWINFISSTDGQCGMVHVAGYSPANPVAVQDCLTAEEKAFHHLEDSGYVKGLDFWQVQPRIEKYVEVWNAVKAAP